MALFLPRTIYPVLQRHLKSKQITVLTGMRRTGKTTLVDQLLKDIPSHNKIYIDLERVDHRELFSEKNYETVIHALEQRGLSFQEKAYVALDEIQLVPQAPSALKYLYDHYPIKFIITGSSSYYLKNLFSESLAGRKKIFELYPLDFGEFLHFKGVPWARESFFGKKFSRVEYERVKAMYEEYVVYGGFPEVALTKNREEKKDLLSDIVSSYINIDVKTLADFHSQENLYAFMKMLAGRCGTKLDYAKISRLSGISRPTVVNYVNFLEKTYIIARLPVMARSPDREIVKAKKLYFCDNGLLTILADIHSGVKFENAIFCQLRFHGGLSYYSKKTGNEIDFILNKTYALEVKESPTQEDQNRLSELAKRARVPRSRLIGRYAVPHFENYIWGGEIR
jgi:predicted AAA+ superfamily ATPase